MTGLYEPRDEDIAAYAAYMEEHTKARIIKSAGSGLELVSEFLDKIGVVNKQEHLSSFGVTLGVTVHVPFDILKPTDGWAPRGKVRMIGHECTHVLQFLGQELSTEKVDDPEYIFGWDYLTNEESRAFYEAEAYASDQEIAYQLWGEEPDNDWVEEQLSRAYAMRAVSSGFAKRLLDVRKKVTVKGGYSAKVTKLTVDFFRARAAT